MLNIFTYKHDNIPTTDDANVKTKIIFTQQVYKKILDLIEESKEFNQEKACFFIGKQDEDDPYKILIDSFTSKFKKERAIKGRRAVSFEKTYKRLTSEIRKYSKSSEKKNIFHFYTHPNKRFSNKYLSMYAKAAYNNPNVNFFGMSAFPVSNSNTYGLSILMPTLPKKTSENVIEASFYSLPNLYFRIGNKDYRLSSFEKENDDDIKIYAGRDF